MEEESVEAARDHLKGLAVDSNEKATSEEDEDMWMGEIRATDMDQEGPDEGGNKGKSVKKRFLSSWEKLVGMIKNRKVVGGMESECVQVKEGNLVGEGEEVVNLQEWLGDFQEGGTEIIEEQKGGGGFRTNH